MAVSDYSTTPSSNTAISGISIAEGCAPGNINDALRQLMADLKSYSTTGASLQIANNLSDLNNVSTARTNLGLPITVASGKTVTFSNTIGFTATDGNTFTFPAVNDTVVGTVAIQTLTNKTLTGAALGGASTATTQSTGNSSTLLATTQFVNATALTLFNGTTATTQSASDNSTKVATTAYTDTAVAAAGGLVLLQTINASAVSTVSFTANINSTYNKYIIEIDNLKFSAAGQNFGLQVSTDGGSTYKSTNYVNSAGGVTSYIDFMNSVTTTNTAGDAFHGTIKFSVPSSASQMAAFICEGAQAKSVSTAISNFHISGGYTTLGAINALQFNGTSGTMTGNVRLYGIKGT